jgi:hypothetical protein
MRISRGHEPRSAVSTTHDNAIGVRLVDSYPTLVARRESERLYGLEGHFLEVRLRFLYFLLCCHVVLQWIEIVVRTREVKIAGKLHLPGGGVNDGPSVSNECKSWANGQANGSESRSSLLSMG